MMVDDKVFIEHSQFLSSDDTKKFVKGLRNYGKNFQKIIKEYLPTFSRVAGLICRLNVAVVSGFSRQLLLLVEEVKRCFQTKESKWNCAKEDLVSSTKATSTNKYGSHSC